jgi:hypothetical protein
VSRLQHRRFGPLNERVLVVTMLRIHGDANVHLEIHLQTLHHERLPRELGDSPRRADGLLWLRKSGHQQTKLGGRRGARACPIGASRPGCGKPLTEGSADQLEQVEVDDEDGPACCA